MTINNDLYNIYLITFSQYNKTIMDKRFELLKIYYDLERENTTSILLIKFN